MTKLQHLKKTKDYLRKVLNYRRNLIRMNAGRPDSIHMAKAIAEVDYALGTVQSFERMMTYLKKKQTQEVLNLLIPRNKEVWKDELNKLIDQGENLQGNFAETQMNLTF